MTVGSGLAVQDADFRLALSHFATGITIVTTRDPLRRPHGMTVNSFTSVSLDPPLVLYCLGKSAFHFDVFAKAEAFAVNVLSADGQALSDRFAREAQDDFDGLVLTALASGSPVLADCLAVLDCEREAVHEAGDHLIVVGRVTALEVTGGPEADGTQPLLYYRSGYRRLMP